ncbi:hypothetical protein [Undibacterium sp. TC9W]|uniref:hypothetical protein n=1 Tax=Undibacterium sp. TC9W TaxID=3413053 RepID=UPI003BF057AE
MKKILCIMIAASLAGCVTTGDGSSGTVNPLNSIMNRLLMMILRFRSAYENEIGGAVKISLPWHLTYAANVVMAIVSLSSIFWGVMPWMGLVGFGLSLMACAGMSYFKTEVLTQDRPTQPGITRGRRRWRDSQINK